jgi:hypothetical protein
MGAACSDPLPESLTIFGDPPAVPAVPVAPRCRNASNKIHRRALHESLVAS